MKMIVRSKILYKRYAAAAVVACGMLPLALLAKISDTSPLKANLLAHTGPQRCTTRDAMTYRSTGTDGRGGGCNQRDQIDSLP
uniref:Uncharacterized protein n=1 Tax=Anopheles braziliensis TaxID=58242 RepID=A0A2M3ZLC2_9DIPT